MRIGKNCMGQPVISTYRTLSGHWCLSVNECGRWFNALLIWPRELVLVFAAFGQTYLIHWHVNWGWKPRMGPFWEVLNRNLEDAHNRFVQNKE